MGIEKVREYLRSKYPFDPAAVDVIAAFEAYDKPDKKADVFSEDFNEGFNRGYAKGYGEWGNSKDDLSYEQGKAEGTAEGLAQGRKEGVASVKNREALTPLATKALQDERLKGYQEGYKNAIKWARKLADEFDKRLET